MQEYLQHTRLGEAMDALGFRLLALALSMGWFILLWGLRLPALLAGAALFILVLLIEKKTRDERLLRREKKIARQNRRGACAGAAAAHPAGQGAF